MVWSINSESEVGLIDDQLFRKVFFAVEQMEVQYNTLCNNSIQNIILLQYKFWIYYTSVVSPRRRFALLVYNNLRQMKYLRGRGIFYTVTPVIPINQGEVGR